MTGNPFTIEALTAEANALKADIEQRQRDEQAEIDRMTQELNERVSLFNIEQFKRTGRLELLNEQIDALSGDVPKE